MSSKWNDFISSIPTAKQPTSEAARQADKEWPDWRARWYEWLNMVFGADPSEMLNFHREAISGKWEAFIEDSIGGYAYVCATPYELIHCIEYDRWINPSFWHTNSETLQEVRDFVAVRRPGEAPGPMVDCGCRMFGCGCRRFDRQLGWVRR